MKKQVKDQIEKMVKECNERHERFGNQSRYKVESHSFMRGNYAVSISFDKTFFSTDFERLWFFIAEYNLNFFMSHYCNETILSLQ